MSRKAYVFSDSKIFIDGISPVALLASNRWPNRVKAVCTPDDLAEDARSGHYGAQSVDGLVGW
jgi:hypothetical protein